MDKSLLDKFHNLLCGETFDKRDSQRQNFLKVIAMWCDSSQSEREQFSDFYAPSKAVSEEEIQARKAIARM
jgi:hypothetical protein